MGWWQMKDYWRLSDKALELEARRHNIGEYATAGGPISRERVITQLVARDSALSDRRAWIALVLSVVSVVVNIVQIAFR